MNASTQMKMLGLALFSAALLLSGCATMGGGQAVQIRMTGAEEVPSVSTNAAGSGSITVGEDRSVSGGFKLQNAAHITAAHIHTGPAGKTGPVIIPLQKVAENEWVVPSGAKLSEAQYERFKAGELYVNFHSKEHKGGEIRGQIRPGSGRSGY